MSENNIWKTELFYITKTLAYICLVHFSMNVKTKTIYKTKKVFFLIMFNTEGCNI